MVPRTIQPYVVTAGLLILAGVLVAVSPRVLESDYAGLRDRLPDTIGEYTGADLRYCQNEQCLRVFSVPDLKNLQICPVCGSTLAAIAPAERQMLPPGTMLMKRRYVSARGAAFLVSILLASHDRNSFHRPQLCLPGQGYVIERSRVRTVSLERRRPLSVTLLEVRRQQGAKGGAPARSLFAYWFVSPVHETPSNMARLFWMAVDRIVYSRSDRWAYLAIMGDSVGPHEDAESAMTHFIQLLYPELILAPAPKAALGRGQ